MFLRLHVSTLQGENNMHGSPGSSQDNVGYGCMQPRMVEAWREIWSTVDGTTDPLAPFGLVTIAPSGSEGAGYHLSAFRWSQTANYGVLPNAVMPQTYVAQAYDLVCNDDKHALTQSIEWHVSHCCCISLSSCTLLQCSQSPVRALATYSSFCFVWCMIA